MQCKCLICHVVNPLRLRFNSSIRVFASALFSVQMLLYMAIVVYAPSIALIQVNREVFNSLNNTLLSYQGDWIPPRDQIRC